MNTATVSEASRSQRLSSATDAFHQHLHTLVAAAAPFDDRERYAKFAGVQYQFQTEIEPLYRRDALQVLVPGLAARSRRAAVAADLADLGVPLPQATADGADGHSDHEALGWLFVSEGSTLGAAILLKRAQTLGLSETFGARYLAPAPEGRATHWRQFIAVLDGLNLSDAEDAQVIAGADAAFRRFADYITQEFKL